MNQPEHSGAQGLQASDASAVICALRLAGAARFDPVHLHFLEVLALRANARQGKVKHLLDTRLQAALAAFRLRFEHAQSEAKARIDQIAPQHPQAVAHLQGLYQAGDVKGLRHAIAALEKSQPPVSLSELARQMSKQVPDAGRVHLDGQVALRPELKTTQFFRETWSKLSVGKRVTQALAQAPKNAGPINSHMLVVRSLALMRDISPDYLNRFTTYVDTLLWLDRSEKSKKPGAKKAAEAQGSKKPKSRSNPAR